MPDLRRYVPGTALSWPGDDALAPVPLHRRVDGTLVFVDVSGFTALSEKLAQRGKVGAEQLTDVLNAVFGTMLGLAAARGGTLLKFGGDALFLLFTGPDHPVQACCAAVEMRHALAQTAKNPSPAGRLRLRMSVGVHTGVVDLFLVGDSHRELVVVGPATTAVAEAEAAAGAGQILVGPRTAEALPMQAIGDAIGPGHLLRWRRPHADFPEPYLRPDSQNPDRFVPTALRQFLSAADPESEHRTVGVSFVRYTGMDALLAEQGHHAAAAALHTMVTSAQGCCDAEGVTFLATDLAEDGGKIIMVAGFPTTAEDDQGRLLRAGRRIVTDSVAQGWPLAVRAGLNRGHVFAGAIGSFERATVTVMGDTVNLAARVMAKASPGQVLATPATLDNAETLFKTEAVEPFMVRGKSGPVSAYIVGGETGTRPPRGLGTLPFLGRDAELATVLAAIDALPKETGSVVTLVGETGIGKTRLLREALAARKNVPAVRARAEPYGAATPYRPLREPLRRLLGLDHNTTGELTAWLEQTVPLFAPDLAPWLPLIGDVLAIKVGETDATRDLDPQFRPDRTADAIVRLIEVLAGGPVIVVLDDAHHADDATAALLTRLERETASHPWLLLSSRRDEDGGYRATEGGRVDLGPLDDDAVRALVNEGTAAAPLRPHDVDSVVARVAGNPLFVEETLRNLREHGDIDALPSSLEGMVAAQIDALSPLARRVVRRASVLGRSFRVGVLRDLFGDEDVALDDATQKELADILEPDGKGRLRFRHALLRDAAYDSLPFNRRRQFHLLAAQSNLSRARGRENEYADSLALHYWMGGDYESTWRWARLAGDQARQTFSNEIAAQHYRRAVQAAARLGKPDPAEVIEAWMTLGNSLADASAFEAAITAFNKAKSLAVDGSHAASACAERAWARANQGQYSLALRDLSIGTRTASPLAPPERQPIDLRIALLRSLVYDFAGRYRESLGWAATAERLARQSDDLAAIGKALNLQEIARLRLGEPTTGDRAREALRVLRRAGDRKTAAAVASNLGALAFFEGRWDEALSAYAEASAAYSAIGDLVSAGSIDASAAEILVLRGEYEDACTLLEPVRRVAHATGSVREAAFADIQYALARAHIGDLDAALTTLEPTIEGLRTRRDTFYVETVVALAETYLLAGRPGDALVASSTVGEGLEGSAYVWPRLHLVQGLARAALGQPGEALADLDEGRRKAQDLGLPYDIAVLDLASASLQPRRQLSEEEAHRVLELLGIRTDVALAWLPQRDKQDGVARATSPQALHGG